MKSTEIGRIMVMTTRPLVSPLRIRLPESTCRSPSRPAIGATTRVYPSCTLRVVDLRLVRLQRTAILIDERLLRRHLLFGDQALTEQLLKPFEVALGIAKPRLVLDECAFRLRQSRL